MKRYPRRAFMHRAVRLGAGLAGAMFLSHHGLLQAQAAESTFQTAQRTKKLTVGIANEKPYGYVDTAGKPTGAIVEIIRAVLAPYGITELDANVVDFGALIPGINASRFDIIGAGMYIRPARCKAIAFSNPVTRSGGAFLAKKGNPTGVHSLREVAAKPNVTLGTQTGTSQVEEVKQAGIGQDRVMLFAKDTEALAGLQAGRVDVIYFPDLEVNTLLETSKDPSLERVAPFDQIMGPDGQPAWNYQALGFRKADGDLIEAVNKQIATLLSSGKLLEIIKPYGYSQNELPPADVTAEKICTAS
jgi:polar amino acid transport system substrate-binding protein